MWAGSARWPNTPRVRSSSQRCSPGVGPSAALCTASSAGLVSHPLGGPLRHADVVTEEAQGAAEGDFFVSHAGRDQAWAEWVAWHLREAGYTVELACWDWAAGENFVKRMHAALESANRVVALFSSAYFDDPRYTTEEWTSALVRNDKNKPRLLPVQIEPCRVPLILNSLVRIELFGVDETEAARRLVAAARSPTHPNGKPWFPGQGRAGALTGRGEEGPRRPGVLPSVWNVRPRNPRFVGRDSTLGYLRERFRSDGTAVVQALHGMGGVGKTQLAIEYAHRFAGAYDVVWWISAEEASLIGEQYAALAIELELISRQADIVSAVGALRAYLRQHSRWLLLLDNAESPQELWDWLPAGPGHILITSHNPGWDELATVRVEVDVLPRLDSVGLIHKYRPGAAAAETDRLAVALGDLPLALAQAAKFLAETGMSVDRYLDLVETQTEDLLNQSPPESHPHSLVAVSGWPPTGSPRTIRPHWPWPALAHSSLRNASPPMSSPVPSPRSSPQPAKTNLRN